MPTAADREIRREILKFLRKVETAWLGGRFDELRSCFREDAVLLGADLEQRLEGRDAIVDVIGDAAVTVTPWTVRYEREGTIYDETGGDLLVLARDPEGWKVAWRTLLPREAADG